MKITFHQVEEIVKTLPIGLYAKRRIPMSCDAEAETSYYVPSEDRIVISFPIIATALKALPDNATPDEIETAIRSMVYHETGHGMLTPKSLMDYADEVVAKTKSKEFSALIKPICDTSPNVSINNRFKIYYGSQGTGKTAIAQKETDMRCIVCNSSMLSADLMEDFVFVDGKATFKPSMLWRCMEEGKGIVLDEINLLPFDSLRFLQGILDGKTEFQYKGNTVHINEGFQVIGTMNLTVNGMTYGLPEPLVDRCAEMRKFSLSADDLAKAILA